MNKEELTQLDEVIQRLQSIKQSYSDGPKFEVGRVYLSKESNGEYLFYFNKEKSYGFFRGEWSPVWSIDENNDDFQPFKNVREATTEEWKQALDKERIKRGIVEGVTVKQVGSNYTCYTTKGGTFVYGNIEEDSAYFGGRRIYNMGQWAEVVPEKIMVGKWEVEFFKSGNCVHINNRAVHINELNNALSIFNSSIGKPTFKILFEGEELTFDTCQKIINNLKKINN